MLRKTLLIINLLTISIAFAGGPSYHHNVGFGAAWQKSTAGLLKYNARLNLFNTDTWSGSVSATPYLGAEFGREDGVTRPVFFAPITLNYNWGMGSSFDCLRYKGYSVNLGIAPTNFATTSSDIINDNMNSYPFYFGFDYKFQTRDLRTFSIDVGGIFSQFDESYIQDVGLVFSLNYHFGLY